MSLVHIANTDFEFELANPAKLSIDQSWEQYPTCLQLQFLPLLFGSKSDMVAITALPDPMFLERSRLLLNRPVPELILLKEMEPFSGQICQSWAPSLEVKKWAQERNMGYFIPDDWRIIQQINSKAFSLKYSPLKQSRAIGSFSMLQEWLKSFDGVKVLKTCFGLSGLGHLIIDEKITKDRIIAFCSKEWEAGRLIIAEPWLERIFDFSTQWLLSQNGFAELLGSTVFEADAKGRYQGTLAGDEGVIFHAYLPFLQEHIFLARKMLKEIFELGYFGHVGIDAFLYRCPQKNETCLYPIVEINGRKTLSYVALRMQQLSYPNQTIRLAFKRNSDTLTGLLPQCLKNEQGRTFTFKRQLTVEIMDSYP